MQRSIRKCSGGSSRSRGWIHTERPRFRTYILTLRISGWCEAPWRSRCTRRSCGSARMGFRATVRPHLLKSRRSTSAWCTSGESACRTKRRCRCSAMGSWSVCREWERRSGDWSSGYRRMVTPGRRGSTSGAETVQSVRRVTEVPKGRSRRRSPGSSGCTARFFPR